MKYLHNVTRQNLKIIQEYLHNRIVKSFYIKYITRYVTTLSTSETLQRPLIGWLVNDNWKRICKDAIVT